MTKSQIKAELRRSACDDEEPYYACHPDAFAEATKYKNCTQWIYRLQEDNLRIFYLLVAESL